MALDAEQILKEIKENGFFKHEDVFIGEEVGEIVKYQPFSEEGLEFLAERAIHEDAVSKVIISILGECRICWYKYNRNKAPIFVWLKSEIPGMAEIHSLSLQWHKTGSKAIFWLGSHLKELKYHENENFGIPEVVAESLKQEGIREEEVSFPHGGFTIYDSRMAFKLVDGGALDAGAVHGKVNWMMRWREGMTQDQKARIMAKMRAIETEKIKFLE